MTAVWALQHSACETLGTIAKALNSAGLAANYVRTFAGQPVPAEMGEAAGLIVMGGPMGVYEQPIYPFLTDEIRLIEHALRQGKPVLGVCLGSQLLAAALGSAVTKGRQKEIGWRRVVLGGPAASDRLWAGVERVFTAFHWHGDVFELPPDAVSLASSELTECQAFRHGPNAYGLLFHAEVTSEIVQGMAATFADELAGAGVDAGEILRKTGNRLPRLQAIGDLVFGRWAALIEGER